MIRSKNLKKSYESLDVLKGVNFKVEKSEIISIIELILNKYYLRVKEFITNRFSKSEVQH